MTSLHRWFLAVVAAWGWQAGVAAAPLENVAAVSAGTLINCVLTTAGAALCWGEKAGDGTAEFRGSPVNVVGLASGVTAISAGHSHACAITAAGGLKCWGSNAFGQLGDGTTLDRLEPVDVQGLTSGVAAVAAGTRARSPRRGG